MEMMSRQLLDRALAIANTEDWTVPTFTLRKAYAAAVVSELTYQHITQLEIADTARAHLIPSYMFQLLHALEDPPNIFSTILSDTRGDALLQSDPTVVVIVPTEKVVFVAIRGTESLADVLADINFESPRKWPPLDESMGFHEGFVKAALADRQRIAERLDRHAKKGTPLCLTGHSLGGAVSSVLYLSSHAATWSDPLLYPPALPSCLITFGMPRFSTPISPAMAGMSHVRRAFDGIPKVPPAVLGYYTSGDIYRPDGTPVGTDDGDSLSKFAVARSTLTFRYLRDHAIEKYRVDLAKNPGVR